MRIDLIERLNYCGRALETSALSRTVEELEEAGQLMQQAAAALRDRLAQPEQEPVAWHTPECEGECIACLIERTVEKALGESGRDYLLRHVTAPQGVVVPMEMPESFAQWLESEIPSGTVISNPRWWAPKIYRALFAAAKEPK